MNQPILTFPLQPSWDNVLILEVPDKTGLTNNPTNKSKFGIIVKNGWGLLGGEEWIALPFEEGQEVYFMPPSPTMLSFRQNKNVLHIIPSRSIIAVLPPKEPKQNKET